MLSTYFINIYSLLPLGFRQMRNFGSVLDRRHHRKVSACPTRMERSNRSADTIAKP